MWNVQRSYFSNNLQQLILYVAFIGYNYWRTYISFLFFFLSSNVMLKVKNRSFRKTCGIPSKFTLKTTKQHQISVFIATWDITFWSNVFCCWYWKSKFLPECCLSDKMFHHIFIIQPAFGNTREIWGTCSKLTIKKLERPQWRRSDFLNRTIWQQDADVLWVFHWKKDWTLAKYLYGIFTCRVCYLKSSFLTFCWQRGNISRQI